MICKRCASTRHQDLVAELTIALPLTQSFVYVSQNISVCLERGLTELVVPPTELEKLNKDMGVSHRRG
jgi:hypothetical protein